MSDEISVEGKEYVSSKKASRTTGYSQDYIGQLARKGVIDARRVGGLWYILMDSLELHKKRSEEFSPEPPKRDSEIAQDTLLSFDGRDFVSASRAAEITGYNQDYVGQLARSGAVLSKQVGNRWFVDREALRDHKAEKDSLLAAVQSQSVGLKKSLEVPQTPYEHSYAGAGPFLTYTKDDQDLFPTLSAQDSGDSLGSLSHEPEEVHQVPIHVLNAREIVSISRKSFVKYPIGRTHGKTIFYGASAAAALTIVIVLSFGFGSLKERSMYTLTTVRSTASVGPLLESASGFLDAFGGWLEHLLVPEISYRRR